jgi:glycosyltransferase involved in cell wall biosynthesis
MQTEPLLSFVVPVYKKTSQEFTRCLTSLFDMSYKNIEVICVFDGADEELQAVASRFKVQSVVVEHGGAPKARNEGFRHSKGELVSFWDADCYAKPEMARMWVETFRRNPDAAFVYSGYEFTGERGGVPGEPFDFYSLQCGNYIATMFPMKREVFPGFDETLKGAQDWDLWLTIAEQGHKGVWIEGFGFVTEPPSRGSISYDAWSDEKYDATVGRIKEKHKIPNRDIVVGSISYHVKALHIAKMIGADYKQAPSWRKHNYRMVINLGYSTEILFENAPAGCKKVQYWFPWDITAFEAVEYRKVVTTLRRVQNDGIINLCNELFSQKRLADLGIEAEILPLPTEITDTETKLPEEFRVLLDIDNAYGPVIKTIRQDMPYINFDVLEGAADITHYSLLLSFQKYPTVDEGIRRFLLNGRNVISNVQAPYCGYIDVEVDYSAFKEELINRVRAARDLPFNAEAQEHYKKIVDPEKFRSRIAELGKPVLEVVA